MFVGEFKIGIFDYTIYAGPVWPVAAAVAIAGLASLCFVLFIAMKFARSTKRPD